MAFREDGTARVLIRRGKADPFGHGRTAFTSRQTAKSLREWLGRRGKGFDYWFFPIYQGKAVKRSLSDTTLKRMIKASAKRVGFQIEKIKKFSGHSMRLGAAQDLLWARYDSVAIMRSGGWKSVEVPARYIENAEHIVWER